MRSLPSSFAASISEFLKPPALKDESRSDEKTIGWLEGRAAGGGGSGSRRGAKGTSPQATTNAIAANTAGRAVILHRPLLSGRDGGRKCLASIMDYNAGTRERSF